MTNENSIEYIESTIDNLKQMMEKEEAWFLQTQADIMIKYEETIAIEENNIRNIDEKIIEIKNKLKKQLEDEIRILEAQYIAPKTKIKTLKKQQRQETNTVAKEFQSIKKDRNAVIMTMERQKMYFTTDN